MEGHDCCAIIDKWYSVLKENPAIQEATGEVDQSDVKSLLNIAHCVFHCHKGKTIDLEKFAANIRILVSMAQLHDLHLKRLSSLREAMESARLIWIIEKNINGEDHPKGVYGELQLTYAKAIKITDDVINQLNHHLVVDYSTTQ